MKHKIESKQLPSGAVMSHCATCGAFSPEQLCQECHGAFPEEANEHARREMVPWEMTHDVCREYAGAHFCRRCGAVEGSDKFQVGCRVVLLPRANYERERPKYPKENADSLTFSQDLEEYYGTADYFGGLASRMGRDLDGFLGIPTGMAIVPGYMSKSVDATRARLCATWRRITRLGTRDQVTLQRYYEGRPFDEKAVKKSHSRYYEIAGLEKADRAREKTGRRYTVEDVAERAGVSERHARRLLANSGIASLEGDGVGRPALVVYESEIADI